MPRCSRNVESRLKEIIGDPAGRLHTARSRNDQVATDFKLWVRDQMDACIQAIEALQKAFLAQAEAGADWVMPGFTHLQTAQPVTWGHHMLAYVEMLGRDASRFKDARKRMRFRPPRRQFARRRGGPRFCAGFPQRRRHLRHASQPFRRGAGDLVLRPIPFRHPVGPLLHRLFHYAAR